MAISPAFAQPGPTMVQFVDDGVSGWTGIVPTNISGSEPVLCPENSIATAVTALNGPNSVVGASFTCRTVSISGESFAFGEPTETAVFGSVAPPDGPPSPGGSTLPTFPGGSTLPTFPGDTTIPGGSTIPGDTTIPGNTNVPTSESLSCNEQSAVTGIRLFNRSTDTGIRQSLAIECTNGTVVDGLFKRGNQTTQIGIDEPYNFAKCSKWSSGIGGYVSTQLEALALHCAANDTGPATITVRAEWDSYAFSRDGWNAELTLQTDTETLAANVDPGVVTVPVGEPTVVPEGSYAVTRLISPDGSKHFTSYLWCDPMNTAQGDQTCDVYIEGLADLQPTIGLSAGPGTEPQRAQTTSDGFAIAPSESATLTLGVKNNGSTGSNASFVAVVPAGISVTASSDSCFMSRDEELGSTMIRCSELYVDHAKSDGVNDSESFIIQGTELGTYDISLEIDDEYAESDYTNNGVTETLTIREGSVVTTTTVAADVTTTTAAPAATTTTVAADVTTTTAAPAATTTTAPLAPVVAVVAADQSTTTAATTTTTVASTQNRASSGADLQRTTVRVDLSANGGNQVQFEMTGFDQNSFVNVMARAVAGTGQTLQSKASFAASLPSTPIVLGTFLTDANGSVMIKAELPAGIEPGVYDVEVSGTFQGQPIVKVQQLEVAARGAAPTAAPAVAPSIAQTPAPIADEAAESAAGELALTGSQNRSIILMGSGLVIIGALMIRRRSHN
jgi:hypothetical protein